MNTLELAIASVPMQQYRRLYRPEQALARGTLFAELEKPLERQRRREGTDDEQKYESFD